MKTIDINLNNIKFKQLSLDRLIISFDRLTRFKNFEDKYTRVFKDILSEALISPKYKKTDLDNLDYSTLTKIAEIIINESLDGICCRDKQNNYVINERLKAYETSLFTSTGEAIKLLDNKINYSKFVGLIDSNIPINLKWLKEVGLSDYLPGKAHSKSLKFPITKVVICEGITEEILLPVFADILNYNFDKNGIQLISAGGKNQVVKLFYKFAEQLKIPIFVLLDSDAEQNAIEIEPKLRKHDKIYRIESGEFEDILPKKLVEKSIKSSIKNISLSPEKGSDYSEGTVHYLEEFYRTRGAHEFKKAEFAHVVKENIIGLEDISGELRVIINEIKNC
ncbi:MAG: ATP-dependent endonuclease [Candidatus Gastranaerophilaceae bacterium]|nr:ATP-dependent endonuclease [Candidatus Gastranaerophilaceae bacterium]